MGWLSGKQFQTLDFPGLLQDLCIVLKGAWCAGKLFLLDFALFCTWFLHCLAFDPLIMGAPWQRRKKAERNEAHPSWAFDPLVIHNHRRERGTFGELASLWLPKAENRWTHALSGTDPNSQTASLLFLTVLMQSVLVLVVTFICPVSILENFERLLDPCKNVWGRLVIAADKSHLRNPRCISPRCSFADPEFNRFPCRFAPLNPLL